MTAYYHAHSDPSYQLGLGHTLNIGESWLDSSECDVFLVSKPYTLGPEFEVLDVEGLHLHFFWLLPITSAERAYRVSEGLEALEQRFEDAGLVYWSPNRPSVV
jgi:hypothetical protein